QEYRPKDIRQLILETEEKAILERNRIELYADIWNNKLRPYEITSKLVEKYRLQSNVLQTNRVLTKQQPLIIDQKRKVSNKRKMSQLAQNIARYDFSHPYIVFHYTFMHSYINFYKLRSLIINFYMGALHPSSELHILLKLYEMLYDIFDQYSNNYGIEISSRLLPLINNIVHFPYLSKLVQQCDEYSLKTCALIIPYHQYIRTPWNSYIYHIKQHSSIHQLYLEWRLFVLLNNTLTIIKPRSHLMDHPFELNLPSMNTNTSFRVDHPYVCVYSTSSLIIFNYEKLVTCFQMKNTTINDWLNVDLFANGLIIICMKFSNYIEIWNFKSDQKLVYKYEFINEIIDFQICNMSFSHKYTILKVILNSGYTKYSALLTDMNEIRLIHICEIRPTSFHHSTLLNPCTDIYRNIDRKQLTVYQLPYITEQFVRDKCELKSHHSTVSVYEFSAHTMEPIVLDMHLIVSRFFHLSHSLQKPLFAFSTMSNLYILHSCDCENKDSYRIDENYLPITYDYVQIPGNYKLVQTKYANNFKEDNYLLCVSERTIFIYEWNCNNQYVHSYRLLSQFTVDSIVSITNAVFTIDPLDGITVFCSFDNGELCKYNATMMAFPITINPTVAKVYHDPLSDGMRVGF
ncbi:unnamed protein product, partial [Didymodactylos carnosus]